MDNETCGNCRFWCVGDIEHECRAHPPPKGRRWPTPMARDWCGEWQLKVLPASVDTVQIVQPPACNVCGQTLKRCYTEGKYVTAWCETQGCQKFGQAIYLDRWPGLGGK